MYKQHKIDDLTNVTFISFIGKKIEFKFPSGHNVSLGFQNLISKWAFSCFGFLLLSFALPEHSFSSFLTSLERLSHTTHLQ